MRNATPDRLGRAGPIDLGESLGFLEATDHYLRIVSGAQRGVYATAMRTVLGIAALPYAVGVGCRNWAYDRRWARVARVERPVVSVGNLTLGGTGKTPMVEWVSRWFRLHGLRVGLLSRGYKAQAGLNDEGLVLDQNLPDVPHLQDRDRIRLARIAIDELDAEVLVLDDGFQHRRLARDLDIVLVDALCPFGHDRLFPRGLLREPTSSLRRAGLVVMSRADLVDGQTRAAIWARIERAAGTRERIEASHTPRDVIDYAGETGALGSISGLRIAAFCGIGNPDGFRRTMRGLGVEPVAFWAFPDHHAYTRADVDGLIRQIGESGAELALTTQKDLVKLRVAELGRVPLRALRIGLAFLNGERRVEEELARVARR